MNKKLVNAKQTKVLWVDLEMTGLNPVNDRILELAAIVTDWKFKELDTFEAAVKVSPRIIRKQMYTSAAAEFWNSVPETRQALIDQSKSVGQTSVAVEAGFLEFLNKHFTSGTPIILAGNSIHMDRKFIDKEWPKVSARLHYRMLDVSAWKLVFEGRFRKKFAKNEAHRALDDIRGSIEELQYYLRSVKNTPTK